MVEQAQVSWADFAGLGGVSKDNVETAFSDNVGGAFFGVGTHKDVTIDSVEPKRSRAGNLYLKVVFSNEDGAIMNKAILIKNKDGGFHFSYTQMAAALLQDRSLRMDIFNTLFAESPEMIDSLRGLKCTIKVGLGKEGFIIRKDAVSNEYQLIDVETSEPYPEVKDQTFENYSDAKDMADELNIGRCYNNIDRISRGSLDAVKANEEALQETLRSSGESKPSITQIGSAAVVPNI